MKPRFEKLEQIKSSQAVDAFLITSSASIKYLCGFFYNFETGPSPFQLIPAALFVVPPGRANLIIADNESGQLADIDPGIAIHKYGSYSYEKPLAYSAGFLGKLSEVLRLHNAGKMRIGIESGSIPHSVTAHISMQYSKFGFEDITMELARRRMIKDADELSFIRAAARLCDMGQESVLKYAKPGISEIELFTLVRGDMDKAAGQRVPMMADLVCGYRTFEGGGNPSSAEIQPGDLILSDLTPCLNGYWGDTCNTVAVGKASPEQVSHFNLVRDALDNGIDAVKPGARACDIDSLLRKELSKAGRYAHHSGHGVGLAYHEEPRIVPYNEMILRPGMVIALEPAIYANGYGIRLEHMVVVNEHGCEKISLFEHRLK
jgi:Xaa-Pro aminopeptidase